MTFPQKVTWPKNFFLLFSVLFHINEYLPRVLSFKIKFSSKIDPPLCAAMQIEKISAESLIPLWRAQRNQWLLCDMHTQRSHWLRCDVHSGVNDSAVQIWHRCDFWHHLCEALATFKGNIYRKNIHRPIVLHYTVLAHTKNGG
jgi:hypothetical protein